LNGPVSETIAGAVDPPAEVKVGVMLPSSNPEQKTVLVLAHLVASGFVCAWTAAAVLANVNASINQNFFVISCSPAGAAHAERQNDSAQTAAV
jgi:hypothetical protein